MSNRITMADVARRAGVHVTTVSLALRDHPSLPECTRHKLRQLADEMGYQPDPSFRALAAYRRQTALTKCSPTLAYVTHWDSEWGWKDATAHHEFFAGAKERATQLGFQLEHFWLGDPKYAGIDFSEMLWLRRIRGVILASHLHDADARQRLTWSRFSAVKIDYFPHDPGLHLVSNDQRAIIGLAFARVLEAGYRRIGFVMHRGWDLNVDHWWTAGFFRAQHRVPDEDRVPICLFPPPRRGVSRAEEFPVAGFQIEAELLGAWIESHRPEVIVSNSDFVFPALRKLGMRVPRDVAFADLFLKNGDGQIAGVQQNHAVVGASAVQFVAGQLQQQRQGLPEVPLTTCVEGTWFDGKTLPVRKVESLPHQAISVAQPAVLDVSGGRTSWTAHS